MRPTVQLHPTSQHVPKPVEATAPPMVLPQAETLFFDAAPVFSHANGIVSVTLTTRRYLPDGKGGVAEQDVVVGFLRCGVQSARSLRQAIDAALLLARPIKDMPAA